MLNQIRIGPTLLVLLALGTLGCGDDVVPGANPDMGAGGRGGNGGNGGQAGEPGKDMGMPMNLCGNGRRDRGEQCDDGNLENEDGCDDMCRVEMLCGNGDINDGEECDEEAPDCLNCLVQATDVSNGGDFPGAFQDGSFDRFRVRLAQDLDFVFEASDGANGCPGEMEMELFEVTQRGELQPVEYDFGSGPGLCPRIAFFLAPTTYELVVRGVGENGVDGYTLSVRTPGSCGDNRVNIDEDCDDGNTADGDGCSAQCVVESECGDGVITGRETCDDGNRSNDDGCDEDCSLERMPLPRGLEHIDSAIAEASSDTFVFTADGPSQLRAYTGDGRGDCPPQADTVMVLYRASDGAQIADNDDAPGRGFCSGFEADIEAGDYELRVTEAFENDPIARYTLEFDLSQNVTAGGLFNGAFIEDGNDVYRLNIPRARNLQLQTGDGMGGCPGDTYMRVFKVDADGRRRFYAEDDDGGEGVCSMLENNFAVGDYVIEVSGFNSAAIEAYTFGVLSEGNCGDGAVNLGEECDDMNLANGDGCSRDCRIEVPCGNGIVDEGEQCDDGNDISGDGCDSGCSLEETDIINGAVQVNAAIGAGGQDRFRFVADGTSRLFVSTGDGMGACPEGADTVMVLNRLGAGGMVEMIEENDDAEGIGLCSAVELEIEAGQYELVVRHFRDGVDIPAYVLDFFMARDLGVGGDLNGVFLEGGDDVFTLNLEYATAAQFITSDGQGGCPGDVRLVLESLDGMGAASLVGDIGEAGSCARIQRSLDQGYYRLTASGVEGVAMPQYVLSAILAPEPNECGNGRLEVGEECDDGNLEAGDGCSQMCAAE